MLTESKNAISERGDCVKIAFTGGPASGKTETIKGIREKLAAKHHKEVIFLPEVATSYLIDQPEIIKRLNNEVLFDYYIFRTEFHIESLIESYNKDLIMICDRGVSDIYAFLPKRTAQKVIGTYANRITNNYDLVLFFENDPTGTTLYKDKKIRTPMNLRKANRLSVNTKDAWEKHNKNIIYIPQFPSIEEKIVFVAKTINNFVNKELFL